MVEDSIALCVLALDELREVVLDLDEIGYGSELYRKVLQQGVAPHQHLLRGMSFVDVVGLVRVEELVETLLSLEEGVADDVIRESSLEVLLRDGVLVSGAIPSQPLQQRPDNLNLIALLLGLEVVLGLVVPGVDESEVVVSRACAVEEVLQHRLVHLIGQEEVLPIVLLRP